MWLKRLFDVISSIILLLILAIPMLLIGGIIKLDSNGPIIFWSERVGIKNKNFFMPKFRTMKGDTPLVATHNLSNPSAHITSVGVFLRRYSLDELPQLWSILIGDMSLVGPRPALFNQNDLIKLRNEFGINLIKPGLTGLAQISGRDQLSIFEKVELDREYLLKRSFFKDLKILFVTLHRVANRSGVSH